MRIILLLLIWIGIDIMFVVLMYRRKTKRIEFDDGYLVVKKENELP